MSATVAKDMLQDGSIRRMAQGDIIEVLGHRFMLLNDEAYFAAVEDPPQCAIPGYCHIHNTSDPHDIRGETYSE